MKPTAPQAALPCPPAVRDLVARFSQQREAYQDTAYNETQVRREFIDPFFAALGWDVDNNEGRAEAYKDVIHEDAIKVGGTTKAPDYCFRIGGTRKFFVEAKKPSVGVKDDPGPAYQLRRYAWSNKLPLSIVTDFEELAVYDCRIRPNPTDKASTARVMYLTFDEYPEKWGEVASIFSKDAILKGSFDKYAESNRRKRGTAEVDAEFLKEIESWRETLAANIALRNPGLSVRDLNYAVGKIIDRIIFLRMCEDRGVETYAQLRTVLNGTAVYRRLVELFYRADERYNSGLFHFQVERGRPESPDELTPALIVDDKVLKDIIRTLYYPECPYEFSVLPAEILGQVYEQFLGKVIRLTAGHRAKVEEKPEVRKAGGVYYTPAYIVDYIVKHTVGKLLEGKTPADVGPDPEKPRRRRSPNRARQGAAHLRARDRQGPASDPNRDRKEAASDPNRDRKGAASDPNRDREGAASDPNRDREGAASLSQPRPSALDTQCQGSGSSHPLRILDPACGSGSFLLGAYQYLLDWHRNWYVNDGPDKHPDRIYQGAGGQWRLTIAEKKRILLNNIYGVDIDPQAVEVTKLSLLLRVLEGETQESLDNQLRLFHERALPDLGANIKCGNSLIGPDFYDGQQMSLFDEEERYRINAFDWHAEFPQVFPPNRDRKEAPSSPNRARQPLTPSVKGQEAASSVPRARKEAAQEQNRDREEAAREQNRDREEAAREQNRARQEAAHMRTPDRDRALGPQPAIPPGATVPLPDGRGSDNLAPDSGFDAVIGNPPYIRMEAFKELKEYLRARYRVHDERSDLYVYFIEREHELLHDGGMFGMIVSNKFLRANYGRSVREMLSEVATVHRIVDLAGLPIFASATVRTIVLITTKGRSNAPAIYSPPPDRAAFLTLDGGNAPLEDVANPLAYELPQAALSGAGWNLAEPDKAALVERVSSIGRPLIEVTGGRICRGVVSGLTAAFVISGEKRAAIVRGNPEANDIIRPFLQGRNIRRYRLAPADEYLIYTHHGIDMRPYPGVIEHLRPFRKRLEARATKQAWYELQQPQYAYKELLESPKLVFPDIATGCRFAPDSAGHFGANTVYFLPTDDLFLLGVLNSRVAHFYFAQTCAALEGPGQAYLRFFGQYLEGFPVCDVAAGDGRGDRMVQLVEQMLSLHKQLDAARTPTNKIAIQRQFDATDRQIDQLVYQLYGLTDDEIRIVEEATQR